jgi:hypothetical protein
MAEPRMQSDAVVNLSGTNCERRNKFHESSDLSSKVAEARQPFFDRIPLPT